jgi:6-phosphogluconate dehydrogenase (decarboxylating)
VGGRDGGVKIAEPILKTLGINNDGYIQTYWPTRKWSFCKACPNGIEFGMLHS